MRYLCAEYNMQFWFQEENRKYREKYESDETETGSILGQIVNSKTLLILNKNLEASEESMMGRVSAVH